MQFVHKNELTLFFFSNSRETNVCKQFSSELFFALKFLSPFLSLSSDEIGHRHARGKRFFLWVIIEQWEFYGFGILGS